MGTLQQIEHLLVIHAWITDRFGIFAVYHQSDWPTIWWGHGKWLSISSEEILASHAAPQGREWWFLTPSTAQGKLLTSTEDILEGWKVYFDGLFNPTKTYSEQEADLIRPLISISWVSHLNKSAAVEPQVWMKSILVTSKLWMLSAVLLDRSLQDCVDIGDGTTGVADTGGGSFFKKGGKKGVLQLSRGRTPQPPW